MIILLKTFGSKVHDLLELLIFVACIWFPLIHPFFVFLGARRQAAQIPKDLELVFDALGMHVSSKGKTQYIGWKDIKSAVKQYNMILIRSDAKHGYMINNKMMGDQKDAFWEFLKVRVRHN
jgi:hypothetical protein